MFTKTGNWTDPHGSTHTDAVFQISKASFNESTTENEDFRLDSSGGFVGAVPVVNTTGQIKNNSLSYSAYFWTNEQSRLDGDMPWTLVRQVDGTVTGNFVDSNLGVDYDGLSAEEKAEKHLKENILNV